MRLKPRSWNLDTVLRREPKINPRPQYQRTPVWSLERRQLFIDSLLRGYDVPKLYLRSVANPPFEHEVIDGQQRLRAIWEFLRNEYALGEDSGELAGKHYRDLPSEKADQLALYELSIVDVEEADELEIRDLFLRLQEGVTLNPAERRNAMPGSMRDFIADLGENHAAFARTRIDGRRFGWHDLAALVTCLELAQGPCDVKAPSLRQLYAAHEDFDANGPEARRIRKILNYVSRVLVDKPPEMDIKWGFIDLYLAISQLERSYDLAGREGEVAQSFIAFERERRAVDDPSELIEGASDPVKRDLYDYIQSFQTGGGRKDAVSRRHEVYVRRLMSDIGDLEPKDARRTFDRDQRLTIWRRADGRCQACGESVVFDAMHADHVVPHARGGKTVVANGQCLCAPCNLAKGGAGAV